MWEFLGLVALVAITFVLFALFLWWLIPLAFPGLAFGFWNAVALAAIIEVSLGAGALASK